MLCPCCTGQEYEVCCAPFHKGVLPDNALQLMRSRYSAYALNKPDYIIATTDPAAPSYSENKFAWKRHLSHFSQNTDFQRLKILDFKESDLFAIVTFVAVIAQHGEDSTFTERSIFQKIQGRWYYRNGEMEQGEVKALVQETPVDLLPVVYYDDPFLRKKAEGIDHITNGTKELARQMVETMDSFSALGIAAPQIHQSIKLFVLRTPIERDGERVGLGDVQVFVNPKLSDPSHELWKAPEGCLSIPTIRALVERPREITVEYTGLDGVRIERRAANWEARVIMHENDHLQGTLFIDRLDKKGRDELAPYLDKLKKRVISFS